MLTMTKPILKSPFMNLDILRLDVESLHRSTPRAIRVVIEVVLSKKNLSIQKIVE